ncbi:unnamed protein product [Paramecium pentaurelia]|uniref:Uncharacterized protein n=1 Tax=Paramecium pentaurelia TaxID=43138 RepID=A0A8S1TXR8_9CILI|nr:unnamed protein product [Paramecium pentaurelia]
MRFRILISLSIIKVGVNYISDKGQPFYQQQDYELIIQETLFHKEEQERSVKQRQFQQEIKCINQVMNYKKVGQQSVP